MGIFFQKIDLAQNGVLTTGREFLQHSVGENGLINQEQRWINYHTIKNHIKLKITVDNFYDYGLHFRSTDKYKEGTNCDVDAFIVFLHQIQIKGNVFLATDSKIAFGKISKYLMSRDVNLQFQEIARNEKPIHLTRGSYKSGQEAIYDMVSISRSKTIIHNKSNMSAAALSFNPSAAAAFFN